MWSEFRNGDQELESCAQSVVAGREPSEGLRRNRGPGEGFAKYVTKIVKNLCFEHPQIVDLH